MSTRKFKFKLEPVMRIEEQIERVTEIELLKAKQKLDKETRTLSQLEQSLEKTFQQIQRAIDAAMFSDSQQSCIKHIETEISQQKLNIEAAQKEFQTAAIKKLKQTQRVESLEKLRKSEHANYTSKQFQIEQQTLLDSVLRTNHFPMGANQ